MPARYWSRRSPSTLRLAVSSRERGSEARGKEGSVGCMIGGVPETRSPGPGASGSGSGRGGEGFRIVEFLQPGVKLFDFRIALGQPFGVLGGFLCDVALGFFGRELAVILQGLLE